MDERLRSMLRSFGALVAVTVLLGGCSARGLPSDFAVYRGGSFAIGYPRTWTGCQGEVSFAGSDEPAVEFTQPARVPGAIPPVIQVTDEGTTRAFAHAVNFHRLLLQVSPGFKNLGEDDLTISGATKAIRIDFREQSALPGQPTQPEIRGRNILVEAPGGRVVSVLITATMEDFSRLQGTFDDVVCSLAVGNDQATPGPADRALANCS
jgi:hypothetical protein